VSAIAPLVKRRRVRYRAAVAEFVEAVSLVFVLLNPFALSVYLVDVIHQNHWKLVLRVLLRASIISFAVFAVFALAGELVFTRGLNVRFAAFQIFGGLVFLLVGIRLMLGGAKAIETLRGPAEHMAGAIAMPFMIGPGTVSAAVLVGSRLTPPLALLSLGTALVLASVCLVGIKLMLDRVRELNSRLIERYVDIAGRVAALIAGSVAVEMIMQGFDSWLAL
jgi:small neutral amino acid transporter SnatA (MarC family)